MGDLLPMPRIGDVFDDLRGDDRTMRVSRHPEHGVVVVSLWAGKVCRASFQLPATEVDRVVTALSPRVARTADLLAVPEAHSEVHSEVHSGAHSGAQSGAQPEIGPDDEARAQPPLAC